MGLGLYFKTLLWGHWGNVCNIFNPQFPHQGNPENGISVTTLCED